MIKPIERDNFNKGPMQPASDLLMGTAEDLDQIVHQLRDDAIRARAKRELGSAKAVLDLEEKTRKAQLLRGQSNLILELRK